MTQANGRSEFAELIEAHRGILYKVATGYCREPEERPDLIQEMVLQLWRAWPQYRQEQRFSTWMYRIALNVAISFYRRAGRWRLPSVALDEVELGLAAADREVESASDDARLLQTLIMQLNPLDRALMLLYLDGHTSREIAEILGLTSSNVSTKLNRLKGRIQQAFEKLSTEPGGE